MNIFIALLIYISAVSGAFTPGFRVKWGRTSQGGSGTEFFYDTPRNVSAAEASSWELTSRPDDSKLSSLTMYCKENDYTFCTMYDDNGFAAGYQIALYINNFTYPVTDMSSLGYTAWQAPDGNQYWANSVYFVSEEYLSSNATLRQEKYNSSTFLQNDAAWVTNFDGSLIRLDGSTGNDENNTFSVQTCIQTMGTHNYYNMSSATSCDRILPWYALTSEDQLIGTGFMAYGVYSWDTNKRDWFEHQNSTSLRAGFSDAPDCVYNWADSPGIITMHVFYIDQPAVVACGKLLCSV